ncbi:hypothetical protein AAE478_009888 [Parahypoxylon ruwenzoriense]
MDAIKNFASNKAGGNKSSNNYNSQKSGEKKDLGDKIAGFINKREGGKFTEQQLETGTDKARQIYEKTTGHKVDPRISN